MSDDSVQREIYSIVFQADSRKGLVSAWFNGDKAKHILKIDVLESMALQNDPKSFPAIVSACRTFSFYLWDTVDNTVIKLMPHAEDQLAYQDPIMNSLVAQSKGQSVESIKQYKDPESIQDELQYMGFDPPNPQDTSQLNVVLRKQKPQSKFFGLFRK